jgi:hypothetical protein
MMSKYYMDDLLNVVREVKRLQREVDDAEWEGDMRLAHLARKLAHFKRLEEEGVIYEPKF